MIRRTQSSCKLPSATTNATIIYEDNSACISQIERGYIKRDKKKHILPKLFCTHDLKKESTIEVKKIQSNEIQTDYS